MLPNQHGGGRDWTSRLVGWIFTLLVISLVADAVVDIVRPFLPWLLVIGIVAAAGFWWVRRYDNW